MTRDLLHEIFRLMLGSRAWLVLVLACALGCGGGSGGGGPDGAAGTGGSGAFVSCAITESSNGATFFTLCQEGTGFYADQIRAACSRPSADAAGAPQAAITSQPCPHTNAVGGCTATNANGTFTGWYYVSGGFTANDIAGICAGAGETFVAP